MLKGKVIDLKEDGTAIIACKVNIGQFVHRQVKECYIDLIDSRPLSAQQRRMCYALINAIAEWSGSSQESIKQAFKMDFWAGRIDTLATYMCLVHKKCAVCGKRADLHHIDAIGMGNDRNEVQHLGREVLSLCREHHTEIHAIGKAEFMAKYHLNGGITADRTILKIYGLRR